MKLTSTDKRAQPPTNDLLHHPWPPHGSPPKKQESRFGIAHLQPHLASKEHGDQATGSADIVPTAVGQRVWSSALCFSSNSVGEASLMVTPDLQDAGRGSHPHWLCWEHGSLSWPGLPMLSRGRPWVVLGSTMVVFFTDVWSPVSTETITAHLHGQTLPLSQETPVPSISL